MVKGRRGHLALALAALLFTVTLSSGCINAYWSKEVINPDEGDIVYKVREKVVAKHFFNTVISDPNSLENQTTNITTIVDGTEWIRVHIDVRLDDIIIPIPFPLPVEPDRYVHVVITMPDGVTWFEKTYNVTQNDSLQILSPAAGEWVFQVDAVGYGTDAIPYHDGYKVIVNANEPVKKK